MGISMMNCKLCQAVLTSQEVAAYGSRCEDCWTRPGGVRLQHFSDSAAACYPRYRVLESVDGVTNQVNSRPGHHRPKGRRMVK